MSFNLTLHAQARATLHLPSGDLPYIVEKECRLWQVPQRPTLSIIALKSNDECFAAYCGWAREMHGDDAEEHLDEVRSWLDEHKGWEIQWSYI